VEKEGVLGVVHEGDVVHFLFQQFLNCSQIEQDGALYGYGFFKSSVIISYFNFVDVDSGDSNLIKFDDVQYVPSKRFVNSFILRCKWSGNFVFFENDYKFFV
jgi:hypothetical protein